jgi:membrane-bound metal-dependent hydrolase YbcI (DUF457 family)
MTTPEHLIIGLTSANLVYAATHLGPNRKKKAVGYLKILFAMSIAAIIPDIDSFFGSYTSTDPTVGHRGMTHSILGVLVLGFGVSVLTAVLSLLFRLFSSYWKLLYYHFKSKTLAEENRFRFFKDFFHSFLPKPFLLLWLFSFLAGITHLLADLPTPPSIWGGLPLLYPFKTGDGQYARFGATAAMGWYDLKIFYVMCATFTFTTLAVIVGKFFNVFKKTLTKIVTILVFAAIFGASTYSFIWARNYLKTTVYKDDKQWMSYQIQVINTFDEPIKGKVIRFVEIFRAGWKQAKGFSFNP